MVRRNVDPAIKVRQLCCLGLPDTLFIPELIKSLKDVISAESGAYYWIDASGKFSNIYINNPVISVIEELAKNHAMFYADPVMEALFKRSFSTKSGSFIEVPKAFFGTDFYNVVCKPLDVHHAIETTIKIEDKIRGLLLLTRSMRSRPFGKKENAKLGCLNPLIAHALTAPQASPSLHVMSEVRGMAILNRGGQIEHLCDSAKQLLFFCNYTSAFSRCASISELIDIPRCFKVLCLRLINVFSGVENLPPAYKYTSPWGVFVFRAYPLQSNDTSISTHIGIYIEKLEPLSLRVCNKLSTFELSPRQGDAAFFVAMGLTNEQIASKMNISRNTVRDHLEKVYSTLHVSCREDLMKTLSC